MRISFIAPEKSYRVVLFSCLPNGRNYPVRLSINIVQRMGASRGNDRINLHLTCIS